MDASQLAQRWNCTIRTLETLQKKGILKADQKHVRGERDFALSHVEDIEKEYNIFTEFTTIENFAKKAHKHYNTIYGWVKKGKIQSCTLFNPIRIPLEGAEK
jgi:hypothetical protein